MTERHVIVGGNAAGLTAASRAKRLQPSLSVTVLEAGPDISYSICGLPYYFGGRVPRYQDLIYFTPESLQNERGIRARVNAEVTGIMPSRRSVSVRDVRSGEEETLGFDKLLIATGYEPVRPSIEGIEAAGVFTVSRLADGRKIGDWLDGGFARRAVLIGGGYVGLEMAEALSRRGMEVTLVERGSAVFSGLDRDRAWLLEEELESNGVRVHTRRTVERIVTGSEGRVVGVQLAGSGAFLNADVVLVDVGVAPRVALAVEAGIRLGPSGAIAVSERMETSVPSIFAAGNCAETTQRVTGRPFFDPLGTVAAKQGRVAGENMAGRVSAFPGAVGTAAVQVFRITAARTGLSTEEARGEGFRVKEARIQSRFQARYFGGEPGTVKVMADAESGRLLGAQIVGSALASTRIDVVAAALSARMTVQEAAQLDLAYTPPMGTLWNPILIGLNRLQGELER